MSEAIGSSGSLGLGDVSYNVRFSTSMLSGDAQAVETRYQEIRKRLEATPILLKYSFDDKALQEAQRKIDAVIASINRQIDQIKPIKLSLDTTELDNKIAIAVKKLQGIGVNVAAPNSGNMPHGGSGTVSHGRIGRGGQFSSHIGDYETHAALTAIRYGREPLSHVSAYEKHQSAQFAAAAANYGGQVSSHADLFYERQKQLRVTYGAEPMAHVSAYNEIQQKLAKSEALVEKGIARQNKIRAKEKQISRSTTNEYRGLLSSYVQSQQASEVKSYRKLYKSTTAKLARNSRAIKGYKALYEKHLTDVEGGRFGGFGGRGNLAFRLARRSFGRQPVRSLLMGITEAAPELALPVAATAAAIEAGKIAADYSNMNRNNAADIANASPIDRSRATAQAYRKEFEFVGNQIPLLGGVWNSIKEWNYAQRGLMTPEELERGVVREGRLRSGIDKSLDTNNQIASINAQSNIASLSANRQTFAARRAGIEETNRERLFAVSELKRKSMADGTWGNEYGPGGLSKEEKDLRASYQGLKSAATSDYWSGMANVDIEIGVAKYDIGERSKQLKMSGVSAGFTARGMTRATNRQDFENERDAAIRSARRAMDIAPDEVKGEAKSQLDNTIELYRQRSIAQKSAEGQFTHNILSQRSQAEMSASGNRFGAAIMGINLARDTELFPHRGDKDIANAINGKFNANIREATLNENVRLQTMKIATERLNANTSSMHTALSGHPLEAQLDEISADASRQIQSISRRDYAAGPQGDKSMADDVAAIKANARGKAAMATFEHSNRGHAEQVGMGIMAGQGLSDNTRFERDSRVNKAIAKIRGGAGIEAESPEVVGGSARASQAVNAAASKVKGFMEKLMGQSGEPNTVTPGKEGPMSDTETLKGCLTQLQIIASRIMDVGLIR